ncbi:ENTH/VHS/GAT family protein [Striga asiatica]|uniref:ENTH/VHS/GAT family protein n=1 Tax=Striga asiatica TaxID=4170 RepID=A0A5A7RG59_STRAF|nr:ENTH/VHS/GAT family protein [Striga asiatica]
MKFSDELGVVGRLAGGTFSGGEIASLTHSGITSEATPPVRQEVQGKSGKILKDTKIHDLPVAGSSDFNRAEHNGPKIEAPVTGSSNGNPPVTSRLFAADSVDVANQSCLPVHFGSLPVLSKMVHTVNSGASDNCNPQLQYHSVSINPSLGQTLHSQREATPSLPTRSRGHLNTTVDDVPPTARTINPDGRAVRAIMATEIHKYMLCFNVFKIMFPSPICIVQ